MAADAGGAGAFRGVVRVTGLSIAGRVTAEAEGVAGALRAAAVNVVAVPAAHALRVHPAHLERDHLVELRLHLPVGIVEVGVEELGLEAVQELAAGDVRRVLDPAAVAALARAQERRWIAARVGVARCARCPHVNAARSVARLAPDAHLHPATPVRVGVRLVALLVPRRVAEDALGVGVHAPVGPMPEVFGPTALALEEIEPFSAHGIEGEGQRLQAARGERAHILLDVAEAENVGERHVLGDAERRSGHHESPVAGDDRAATSCRRQHRKVVQRALPRVDHPGVTRPARLGTRVRRRSVGHPPRAERDREHRRRADECRREEGSALTSGHAGRVLGRA